MWLVFDLCPWSVVGVGSGSLCRWPVGCGSVIGCPVFVPVSYIICENTKREKSEKMKKGGSQGGRPHGILFEEGDDPTQKTEQNAERREKGENNGKY